MRAEQKSILHKLKIARGQIDGIIKMVEDDAYCIDISNQLLASTALLKKSNREILEAHIRGCVSEAFASDEAAAEEKLEEALDLLERMLRQE